MLFILLINLNYYGVINNKFNYFLGFYRDIRWKLCIHHRARMKMNVDAEHQDPLPTVNNMKQIK
jgi:hypothetical protein